MAPRVPNPPVRARPLARRRRARRRHRRGRRRPDLRRGRRGGRDHEARTCSRIPGVRDSKTLSAAQRERLAPIIRRRAVAIGLGAASVREIDTINIYHATHLAMRRAVARLGGHDHVLVDGNRIAGFEAAGRAVHRDRRRRREGLHDRLRLGRREGRARPDDDAPRGPLPGLRLGAQPGLRHPRAPRRDPPPGPDAVPPAELPRPPADARRRPDQPRPVRRGGRRGRVRGRSSASSIGSTGSARPRSTRSPPSPADADAAAAIAAAEALVREPFQATDPIG